MNWSLKLKEAIQKQADLLLSEAKAQAPNPAATKGQAFIKGHSLGKTTLMFEAMQKYIKEHPALGPSSILIAGADGTMHKMGEASELKINFESKPDVNLNEIQELAKLTLGVYQATIGAKYQGSWVMGQIGSFGPGSRSIVPPARKPQLQPIFERLSELAEEMPPAPASRAPDGPKLKAAYYDEWTLEWALKQQSAQPSFTFNGVDFPGEDIEKITQSVTKEGWPHFSVKLKAGAYDKWKAMLSAGEGAKLPFKMEAP